MPLFQHKNLPPVITNFHDSTKSSSTKSSTPSSPRNVRFAPGPSPVSSTSRVPNLAESWSLYYFEAHARECSRCYEPYTVQTEGKRLCGTGRKLSADVESHVFQSNGELYSTKTEGHKPVRVEVPPNYVHVRSLMNALARKERKSAEKPLINQPNGILRNATQPEQERYRREEVVVEPARSHGRSKHRSRSSKHSSSEDSGVVFTQSGITYRADSVMSPSRRAYKTEIIRPERR